MSDLARTAAALVAPGKGILATGESSHAIVARLAAAGITPTEQNRRAYREMIITTPGLDQGISGVLGCDETLRQRVTDGRLFPAALLAAGLQADIKVDGGTWPLPGAPDEMVTEGLDGLPRRLRKYADLGASFASWRAVFRIGDGTPSTAAVQANAQALGRYAAACQEAGLVAVVTPEVSMAGTHSVSQCETVTSIVLFAVMTELQDHGVSLDGVILRPNMAVPGLGSWSSPSADDVAEASLAALLGMPATLAGVAFLSGGQPPERATEILAALQRPLHVWPLTFAFGRAVTDPALAAWQGDPARVAAGQRALARRIALNAAAVQGRYTSELERDPA